MGECIDFAADIGIGAVVITTECNILSICFMLNSIFEFNINVPESLFIGLLIVWFLCVYYLFTHHDRYKKVVKEFSDETHKEKIVREIYVWTYAISTGVFLLVSIFAFHKK